MAADPNNPIVCTCGEITRADFLSAMGANRDIEYGDLLEKIGAGVKCTACRLDLELLYTDNFDRVMGSTPAASGKAAVKETLPLKARLYRLLDGIAPMMPLRLSNTVPVLRHTGVRQYVVVCNDPPLYENAAPPDPAQVRLILRDSEGQVRLNQCHEVTMDRPLDVEVSELLPAAPGNRPSIGSIEVVRWWKRPTRRGTTRPQIVIEAPGGCGAVHTQGPNGPGSTWYSCLARPGEDRLLLAIVNPSNSPLPVAISYPFAADLTPTEREKKVIPAYGAALHEISVSKAESDLLAHRPFGVRCEAEGMHKCYIITASPGLDRFAIDHPAAA